MNFRLVIILSVVTLLLFGCVRTYRIDIQQGNIVTPEQIEQLKPGMEKPEVRYLLGAPLVEDPFHKERWDYFYSFRSGETRQIEQQRLTVFFDNGKRQTCVVKQVRTNSPLHALTTLNETAFVEAARFFAERVLREGGDDVAARIAWAFLALPAP
jgi:outer membrane protein assembly factor BamE